MKRTVALAEVQKALRRPVVSLSDEEAMAAIRKLRAVAAEIADEVIDLLDRIDGDPDFEVDPEAGIEDLPHDDADEGNDEPSLTFSGERVVLAAGAPVDGELDAAEEELVAI